MLLLLWSLAIAKVGARIIVDAIANTVFFMVNSLMLFLVETFSQFETFLFVSTFFVEASVIVHKLRFDVAIKQHWG
ncbi:hypothetical protein VCRA2116O427_220060 [Vibrio crassostreae]|nr:hypothetical protein VCRA2113O410_210061 [Vibrio crassostreae]CAK2454278.1 hypothetical protein VCRA2113O417_220060 [Vibrio crassostreae]CAK2707206.1 hypothetical protein VCRA2116O427_220060 [Vibrio crassostreae]CAK3305891.1 hypothetical protein VCRA2121O437_230059 [Vibrio crassostreae]CAK3327004.1 hypothetical protein VCRA2127O449_200060 [Vibrio crassostreae]